MIEPMSDLFTKGSSAAPYFDYYLHAGQAWQQLVRAMNEHPRVAVVLQDGVFYIGANRVGTVGVEPIPEDLERAARFVLEANW